MVCPEQQLFWSKGSYRGWVFFDPTTEWHSLYRYRPSSRGMYMRNCTVKGLCYCRSKEFLTANYCQLYEAIFPNVVVFALTVTPMYSSSHPKISNLRMYTHPPATILPAFEIAASDALQTLLFDHHHQQ